MPIELSHLSATPFKGINASSLWQSVAFSYLDVFFSLLNEYNYTTAVNGMGIIFLAQRLRDGHMKSVCLFDVRLIPFGYRTNAPFNNKGKKSYTLNCVWCGAAYNTAQNGTCLSINDFPAASLMCQINVIKSKWNF